MRVRFRILLFDGNKRLKKHDLYEFRDPLRIGMRYVTEFKYLEASKWLLVATKSWERSILLGLINAALGQEDQAVDFIKSVDTLPKITTYSVAIEDPSTGFYRDIKNELDVVEIISRTRPY